MVQKKGNYCSICLPIANKRTRVKEARVVAYLNEWADAGIVPPYTTWNKANPVSDKDVCGKPKPDILYDLGTHIVIVEVDEFQHKYSSYTPRCEVMRIVRIVDGYRTEPGVMIPVHVIRFNPDAQKVNQITTTTMTPWRMVELKKLLVAAIASPDYDRRVTISKLFYDIDGADAKAKDVQMTAYETLEEFEDYVEEHFPFE